MNIIKGRTIEFSTLFLFLDDSENILMAACRSSNYKDCRVFYPNRFPFKIDKRYLKGLQSTYNISLSDNRNEDEEKPGLGQALWSRQGPLERRRRAGIC